MTINFLRKRQKKIGEIFALRKKTLLSLLEVRFVLNSCDAERAKFWEYNAIHMDQHHTKVGAIVYSLLSKLNANSSLQDHDIEIFLMQLVWHHLCNFSSNYDFWYLANNQHKHWYTDDRLFEYKFKKGFFHKKICIQNPLELVEGFERVENKIRYFYGVKLSEKNLVNLSLLTLTDRYLIFIPSSSDIHKILNMNVHGGFSNKDDDFIRQTIQEGGVILSSASNHPYEGYFINLLGDIDQINKLRQVPFINQYIKV